MKKLFLALLWSISFAASAHADFECGRGMTSTAVGYDWCIDRDAARRNPDILYYLHGSSGNARQWHESAMKRDLEARWLARGVGAPTVITFSFGPQWLVGDVAAEGHPALLPLILNEVMPALEKRVGGLRGRRMVMGPSMGGANSSILAMRAPRFFARALTLCPGILATEPDAAPAELEAFFAASSPLVERDLYLGVLRWVRTDFPERAIWSRHDVTKLAAQANPGYPAMYVSCTWDDDYGFYAGAERFAAVLRSRGIRTVWTPIAHGSHCVQTPASLDAMAQFVIAR